MGGLQGLATEAPTAKVVMLGHRWDTACHDLRRFLARNQIAFDWVAPDDAGSCHPLEGAAARRSRLPAVRLADGTVMVQPAAANWPAPGPADACRAREYDTVIIGGGPAGLAAAVYGASEGLSTLVVEREAPGGQAGTSSRIENYLGFPHGVSGDELASRALQQARRLGAEILVTRSIERIDPEARAAIHLDGGEVLRARSLILATGVSWRRLAIEGFDRLIGKGIYYGAARSEAGAHPGPGRPPDRRGQLGRAGGAVLRQPRAQRDAGGARRLAGKEHVALPDRAAAQQSPTSRSRSHSEVLGVHGDDHLTAIDVGDRAQRRGAPRGLRRPVRLHRRGRRDRLAAAEIARDQRGYVLTGSDVVKAGRWAAAARPLSCWRPACPASSRAATCA